MFLAHMYNFTNTGNGGFRDCGNCGPMAKRRDVPLYVLAEGTGMTSVTFRSVQKASPHEHNLHRCMFSMTSHISK